MSFYSLPGNACLVLNDSLCQETWTNLQPQAWSGVLPTKRICDDRLMGERHSCKDPLSMEDICS